MEILATIILLIVIFCLSKSTEWKSNNRRTPSGYEHDYRQANIDLALHGKDYYHKQNLAGKYDIPDEKKEC